MLGPVWRRIRLIVSGQYLPGGVGISEGEITLDHILMLSPRVGSGKAELFEIPEEVFSLDRPPMEASGNLPDEKFLAIDNGESKMLMNPEEDSLLQNLP